MAHIPVYAEAEFLQPNSLRGKESGVKKKKNEFVILRILIDLHDPLPEGFVDEAGLRKRITECSANH